MCLQILSYFLTLSNSNRSSSAAYQYQDTHYNGIEWYWSAVEILLYTHSLTRSLTRETSPGPDLFKSSDCLAKLNSTQI